MALPPSAQTKIAALAATYRRGFVPLGHEHRFLVQAAKSDPTAVVPVVIAMCDALTAGRVDSGSFRGFFNWLLDFARASQLLTQTIRKHIEDSEVAFYPEAQGLAQALQVGLPIHYYDLCREILALTHGCVFVVGAGFSYDSLAPLQRETRFLCCHVLGQHLEVADPQALYDRDEREAWRLIGENGWAQFQALAAEFLAAKEPAEQHRALARMFRDGKVQHIISFNWDDLIERAYYEQFSEAIPVVRSADATSEHALWKLHGDVRSPAERWVLPYENGRVFDSLISEVTGKVLVAFVIGYHEQESEVRNSLIRTLEQFGQFVRVNPSQPNDPPRAFSDTAAVFVRKLEAGFAAVSAGAYPA